VLGRRFADRTQAGLALAERLGATFEPKGETIVCALPRGGVPVAVPIAKTLGAPLDAILVRKLRAPFQPEFAIGALAALGDRIEEMRYEEAGMPDWVYQAAVASEKAALAELDNRYRQGRPAPDLNERSVIVVDDGLATGSTMTAAVRLARSLGASEVVVAAPVGSTSAVRALSHEADDVRCLLARDDFRAVSLYYSEFSPPSDEAVRVALRAGAA
jgi:predicted phosphoribosyltransferase